jgi:hypothetical protein
LSERNIVIKYQQKEIMIEISMKKKTDKKTRKSARFEDILSFVKKEDDLSNENNSFSNDEKKDENDEFDLSMFDVVKSSSVIFTFEKTKKT